MQSLQKILPDKNLAKKQAHLVAFLQAAEIEMLKKIGYADKAQSMQIKLVNANSINDILL